MICLQRHAGTNSEVSFILCSQYPSALMSTAANRAQNRLALNSKLKGQSLGAPSTDDPDSALSFVKKLKKSKKLKEFEVARKKEEELAEREKLAYGEEDLRGLKVAHDADDFLEGEDVILTLKDNRILDGEGKFITGFFFFILGLRRVLTPLLHIHRGRTPERQPSRR
jgi:hypothetical protein